MKKICALCILLVIAFSSRAQLTLTKAANAPIVGTIDKTDNYDSSIAVPKSTGTNKSWNFTSFVNSMANGSQTYVTSSSTPSASAFPGTNLAASDGSGYYDYYNSQTNNLDYLGAVDVPGNDVTIFSNPITMMVWPFTFGTSNADALIGTETFSTSTFNFTGNMNISGTGTGTVTLPNGQIFTNCLQITRTYTYIITGSFTGTITVKEYEYWTGAYRTPIINISYSTIKQPTVTQKGFNITVNAIANVGIEETVGGDGKVIVYPNPAKDIINVQLEENAIAQKLELFDMMGRSVLFVENANKINVSSLPKGVYLLNVKYKDHYMQKQITITE